MKFLIVASSLDSCELYTEIITASTANEAAQIASGPFRTIYTIIRASTDRETEALTVYEVCEEQVYEYA